MMENDSQYTEPNKPKGTGVKNSVISALAALFGIQSLKNRKRDFDDGNPADFIMVGIIIVSILLIGMVILVNVVINSA